MLSQLATRKKFFTRSCQKGEKKSACRCICSCSSEFCRCCNTGLLSAYSYITNEVEENTKLESIVLSDLSRRRCADLPFSVQIQLYQTDTDL